MAEWIERLAKYNFWNGQSFDLGYPREGYTTRIGQYVGNRLVKVLVGQRRAGKSYILRQLAKGLILGGVAAENTLYINKEYIEFLDIRHAEDLEALYQEYRRELNPQGRVYIFIDEVQQVAEWERFVDSHSQDFAQECEVFICGSNSSLMAGELATLLSGRYIQFEVLPFSYQEYCGITGQTVERASYLHYLQGGALPELFHLPSDEVKRNYMRAIKDTIMLRDIVGRHRVKDAQLLDDLFAYLVKTSGSMVSIPNILNYFSSKRSKTNYETVAGYIGYLEDSFLLHKAERYNIRGKTVLTGNCKYYPNDLGYRNLLYPGLGYGAGFLLENAVYLALRRTGWKVYTGETRVGEVDFVAIREDQRIYIQAVLRLEEAQTAEREYRPLERIEDNYSKYLVSLDELSIPGRNGIARVEAWELERLLGRER